MVGLFFKCALAIFVVAVVVGLFLSDKGIENATTYSIFTGVGGIGIGILVLIIGFFTSNTGRETVYHYENTSGDTVHYIGNEHDYSTMQIGFFIGLLSLAAIFLFPIGMLIGIGIKEKIGSKKEEVSSNISETRKKRTEVLQKVRTKAAENNGKIKKNITIDERMRGEHNNQKTTITPEKTESTRKIADTTDNSSDDWVCKFCGYVNKEPIVPSRCPHCGSAAGFKKR